MRVNSWSTRGSKLCTHNLWITFYHYFIPAINEPPIALHGTKICTLLIFQASLYYLSIITPQRWSAAPGVPVTVAKVTCVTDENFLISSGKTNPIAPTFISQAPKTPVKHRRNWRTESPMMEFDGEFWLEFDVSAAVGHRARWPVTKRKSMLLNFLRLLTFSTHGTGISNAIWKIVRFARS